VKTALVTGASGFLGRHFAHELRSRDWIVSGVDLVQLSAESYGALDWGTPDTTGEFINTVHDAHDIFRSPIPSQSFDLVVHCAATAPHRQAIDTQPGNFMRDIALDASLFEWAVRTAQQHVLYVSSSAVYPVSLQMKDSLIGTRLFEIYAGDFSFGEPDGHYGWTKLIGERMADATRDCGVGITIVRPFSGYGTDQSENFPFRAFIERAKRRENPFTIWGSAYQVRDWIHVDDVVRGALAAYESGTTRPTNLCTGVGTTMHDLVEMICGEVPDAYLPDIVVDENAPMGVRYRVGAPDRMYEFYEPKISLLEGVQHALEGTGK